MVDKKMKCPECGKQISLAKEQINQTGQIIKAELLTGTEKEKRKELRNLLVKEYEISSSLYLHADELRESRLRIFIIILLGVLGFSPVLGPTLSMVFTLIVCFAGYFIHSFSQYWAKTRCQNTHNIEKQLGNLSTFSLENSYTDEERKNKTGKISHYMVGRSGAKIAWVGIAITCIALMTLLNSQLNKNKNSANLKKENLHAEINTLQKEISDNKANISKIKDNIILELQQKKTFEEQKTLINTLIYKATQEQNARIKEKMDVIEKSLEIKLKEAKKPLENKKE